MWSIQHSPSPLQLLLAGPQQLYGVILEEKIGQKGPSTPSTRTKTYVF